MHENRRRIPEEPHIRRWDEVMIVLGDISTNSPASTLKVPMMITASKLARNNVNNHGTIRGFIFQGLLTPSPRSKSECATPDSGSFGGLASFSAVDRCSIRGRRRQIAPTRQRFLSVDLPEKLQRFYANITGFNIM